MIQILDVVEQDGALPVQAAAAAEYPVALAMIARPMSVSVRL